MTLSKPIASIVITTRNRRDDLSHAVRSSLSQSVPVEVLVIDDGSTDGTAEMIRANFPTVRLERSENSFGLIVQRNRAARLAMGDIIFSIDDDAIFTSPLIVAQTLSEFDHPSVGAVAIPYIEPRKSPIVRQKAPSTEDTFITDTFIGTAHALRKDIFQKLGGYREHLIHQGEESDFAIRMLEAGYVVRLGNADPIHHMESPRRDLRRMDFYGRRNDILFAWHNVPMRYLPVHMLGTTLHGLVTAFYARRFRKMLQGVAYGYIACFRWWMKRRPVPRQIYRLHRSLKKHGPLALSDVDPLLPALQTRQNEVQSSKVAVLGPG